MIDIHLKYDKTWKVAKMTKTEELELARQTVKNKDEIIKMLEDSLKKANESNRLSRSKIVQIISFSALIKQCLSLMDNLITDEYMNYLDHQKNPMLSLIPKDESKCRRV